MAHSDRAGSVGTEERISASCLRNKAAAYKRMWWDTDGLWWFLAFCCLFFPVAGYHMEGWPTAAIYALAASLALLGHTDNTERAASFFEGRPCTRSRFTWILRAYMALCALVIPVLGYIGRGWLDGVIYLIYAVLILCCHYRAEELRHLNATEARVDYLSRENLATATTEGSSTLKWVLSLGMIKWGGATPVTKRIFWLFIVLIAILTGLAAHACQHLPAEQKLWPISAACGAAALLLWFCCDVNVGRLRGDRFF